MYLDSSVVSANLFDIVLQTAKRVIGMIIKQSVQKMI